MMRKMKAAALASMISVSLAVPAMGAVIINAANTGYSFQVDYVGQVSGNTTPQVSALGTFTFNGVTNGGKTYNFGYSLQNDSTATARLSGFAFNTSPDPTAASVAGAFTSAKLGGNYPESFGTVDVCFNSGGGSCAGGGGGGFFQGDTGTGSFALTFAQSMASVSFESFVTRFQAISGVSGVSNGSSGIGIGSVVQNTPVTAPEPGTWLMMLGGFGLVGLTLRSGRRAARPGAQAA